MFGAETFKLTSWHRSDSAYWTNHGMLSLLCRPTAFVWLFSTV